MDKAVEGCRSGLGPGVKRGGCLREKLLEVLHQCGVAGEALGGGRGGGEEGEGYGWELRLGVGGKGGG